MLCLCKETPRATGRSLSGGLNRFCGKIVAVPRYVRPTSIAKSERAVQHCSSAEHGRHREHRNLIQLDGATDIPHLGAEEHDDDHQQRHRNYGEQPCGEAQRVRARYRPQDAAPVPHQRLQRETPVRVAAGAFVRFQR